MLPTRLLAAIASIIILSACSGPTSIRKEINSLNAQQISDLRLGVAEMQSRPVIDGTSWLYQANIHGVSTPANTCPATGGGMLPAWNTCQHGQYYFLCWHRMYLYYLEGILREAVREATGDPTRAFSLPYWDYATNPQLPAAFRTPGDATNPLYVGARSNACNSGGTCITAGQASAANALAKSPYCDCPAGQTCTDCIPATPPNETFGGEWVPGPVHLNAAFGALEIRPHNVVHVGIGGWMSQVNCAARDPIFYLHHANIDRLWQVWLNQGGGRADPVNEPNWRTQSFTFINARGEQETKTCCDVVHTERQLGYRYEGVPINNVQFCPDIPDTVVPPPEDGYDRFWESERRREIVGRDTVWYPLSLDDGGLELPRYVAERRQILVGLDGVRRMAPGPLYGMYFGAENDEDLLPDSPWFLGHLALFGDTGELGADMTFDITDQLSELVVGDSLTRPLNVTFGFEGPREPGIAAPDSLLSFEGFSLYVKRRN